MMTINASFKGRKRMKQHPLARRGVTLAISGAVAIAGLASPAAATNGYFSNGNSAASKGMAGAGVAVSTGVMGLAQNPALGTKEGNRASFCLSAFAPDRSTTISAGGPLTPGTFKSANALFPVPCAGANFRLNDRSTIGVLMFGNGGMNTEFTTNFFAGLGAGTSPLGVNLEQLFLSVNYSYEVSDQLTVGIAPVLAFQRFAATGLEAFGGLSTAPTLVTNNGDSWSNGVGVNLGVLWEPSAEWTIGAAYRSKVGMKAFDKYAGLFAGGGDFDIPAVATLGASYTPASNPNWTLTAEYQRIFYGDIPALANSNAPPSGPLGAPTGAGFGWKDMDVVRVGAEYRMDPKWTLRGGLSYATKFIDDASVIFNTLAPATPQWHVSVGADYKINDKWDLTMAYTHALDNTVSGTNPALTGVAQPVSIRMKQHEFTLEMTYNW